MTLEPTGNIRIGNPNLISELDNPSARTDSSALEFKDVLKGLVDQVDSLQKNADASLKGLAAGETTDVHSVAIRMEEASVAFDMMMQIRNKLLEAYQEVSRMQP